MNIYIFFVLFYFIVSGMVAYGRFKGEKYTKLELFFVFMCGWFITPILIGHKLK